MPKLTLAILTVLLSGSGIGVNLSAQAAVSPTQTGSVERATGSTTQHSIALAGKRCGLKRTYMRPRYRR